MTISQVNPRVSQQPTQLSPVNQPHVGQVRPHMSIADALPLWADSMNGEGRAALGVKTYLDRIRLFQRWLAVREHSARLEDVTPLLIQAYLKSQRDAGLKPKTVELSYTVISSMLAWAVDSDILQRNSAKKVKVSRSKDTPPKVAKFETVVSQVEHMTRTRFHGIDARDRFAYLLMLYTGMRVSEACNLTWAEVDWERGIVSIPQTKGGDLSVRWVPLHDKLRHELSRWRDVAELIWPARTHVLISRRGKRTHRADIEQAFKRRGWFNPHSLRHAFALRCMEHDVNVRRIQQYLGHASLTMTARYLAILSPDVAADAELVSAAF